MRFIRDFINYLSDRWFRFAGWYSARRDTIGRLEAQIAEMMRRHAAEVSELQGQIEMRDRHIQFLAGLHARQVALIESEMAIHARRREDATHGARLTQ